MIFALTLLHCLALQDLSRLNRDLSRVLVLGTGNSKFADQQADNVIRVTPFKGDSHDDSLFQLLPFIEQMAKDDVTDVREVLRSYRAAQQPIPQEFYRRQMLAKGGATEASKKPVFSFGSKQEKKPTFRHD